MSYKIKITQYDYFIDDEMRCTDYAHDWKLNDDRDLEPEIKLFANQNLAYDYACNMAAQSYELISILEGGVDIIFNSSEFEIKILIDEKVYEIYKIILDK